MVIFLYLFIYLLTYLLYILCYSQILFSTHITHRRAQTHTHMQCRGDKWRGHTCYHVQWAVLGVGALLKGTLVKPRMWTSILQLPAHIILFFHKSVINLCLICCFCLNVSGKILNDDTPLKEYKIDEKNFVVVMVTKVSVTSDCYILYILLSYPSLCCSELKGCVHLQIISTSLYFSVSGFYWAFIRGTHHFLHWCFTSKPSSHCPARLLIGNSCGVSMTLA